MALKSRLQTSGNERAPTDSQQSESSDIQLSTVADADTSPFSMRYDLEAYEFDTDDTDQALGIIIAVTNLL